MIDSVVIKINMEKVLVKNYYYLDGRTTSQGFGYKIETRFCKKYRGEQKKRGIYFPSVEVKKKKTGDGKTEHIIKIQVSFPKMLYGSNAFEISSWDLELICQRLSEKLKEIDIIVSPETIKKAIVVRIDFSKIIKLLRYFGTADQVIKKIYSFNYKFRSEFRIKEYRLGGGSWIKFYNDNQSYMIYDKIGHILDEGWTTKEKEIANDFKKGKIKRDALKFEFSLHRKNGMDRFLKKRIEGKTKDFLLEEILNEELSKKILLDVFDNVFNDIAIGLISLSEMDDNNLRAYLDSSNLSMGRQIMLYYWVSMATKNGYAGVIGRLKEKYKGGSVSRHKKEIALALQELGKTPGNTPNLIQFLRDKHEEFEIIKPQGKFAL